MADFNAKLGYREHEVETALGHHGYGGRNSIGTMLLLTTSSAM